MKLKSLMIALPVLGLSAFCVHPTLAAAHTDTISAAKQSADPVIFLKSVSDQLLLRLKQDRSQIESNPKHIFDIVNEVLVPHVDTVRMARSVVPRSIWMAATPQVQDAFKKSFLNLVVRTYASALNAYTDQQIKYLPIRGGYEGKKSVQVNSQIMRSDGPPVGIVYRLAKSGNQWRVYDMTVEGISLLQSFRSQFASEFSSLQNKKTALAQLTKKLEAHNASTNR